VAVAGIGGNLLSALPSSGATLPGRDILNYPLLNSPPALLIGVVVAGLRKFEGLYVVAFLIAFTPQVLGGVRVTL
jgi:hypothetical protein